MKVLEVLRRSNGFISWKSISATLSLLAIVSCAARQGIGSEEPVIVSENLSTENAAGDTQVAANIVEEQSDSRILSSLEKDSLGIKLVESNSADQLIINAKANPDDFTVNRISNPERIVIDIKSGLATRLNKNFEAGDTQFLSKIRVGSHPDKTRVVLDLPTGRTIQHEVAAQDNQLIIKLSEEGAANTVAAALPVPPIAQEAELIENSDTEALEQAKAAPDLNDAALADNSATEEEAVVAATGSVVKGLSLEKVGQDGNILVANIEAPGVYALKQTAPSEYVLTIKDAQVAQDVSNILATPGSGLIRSVRVSNEGSDAVLRIFAQPDSKLNARAGSDKIVVSAIADDTDFKAQAEPEKAKEEAAKDDSIAKPVEVKATDDDANGEGFEKQLDELANSSYTGRLISLDLQDTDIDNALRIIAEVSNLNIIASDDVTGKVTLRLIDVPWDQALDVILKTNGLDKVREGNVIRIAPVEKLRQEREALKQLKVSQEELEPLQVKYIRISYAKASELKPLIETVVSERGVVSYDERSNQIIVKDIGAGVKNVSELISRVDLRTPQVLLETQIVEASRSLLRDLGSSLGFEYKQSPETGNSTGMNFPNSIEVGGSPLLGGNQSSFPAAVSATGGSAINFLLGSADGSKSLDLTLSALETEGRVRIISRPAVATTNNKQATIKSVEKIRVKTPQGGLSVATGSGASASGASAVATESFEVGIVLEVTPQASPDYYVLLDINAKSSTFGDREVEGVPSERERSATSTVLVSSGQTFAMGGIYKTTDNDKVSGVPFFKDIPFIGHFFRGMRTDNSDEELLFFITPRIVEGSFDDATMKFSS